MHTASTPARDTTPDAHRSLPVDTVVAPLPDLPWTHRAASALLGTLASVVLLGSMVLLLPEEARAVSSSALDAQRPALVAAADLSRRCPG